MNKVRVLSLLSLIVCISAFSIGFDNLSFSIPFTNWQAWVWPVLTLFGIYGTIASISIVMLSFLALKASADGSFIVDSKSLYGKIFLSFICFDDRNHFSICQAFWKTNGVLFIVSIAIGIIVAIIIGLIKAGIVNILLLLAGIVCSIIFGGLLFLSAEQLDKKFKKLKVNRPKLANTIEVSPIILILLVILILVGIALYNLYLAGLTLIWAWISWLLAWAIAAGIVFSIGYGIFKLVRNIFGEEFSSFYHQNLCPNIKIR